MVILVFKLERHLSHNRIKCDNKVSPIHENEDNFMKNHNNKIIKRFDQLFFQNY